MTRATTPTSSSAAQEGGELPAALARLETGLASAFGASDMVGGLDLAHRVRVYDDLEGMIADAAASAARTGHAAGALRIVDLAAERPPRWAVGSAEPFWTRLLETARDAVLASLAD
jgi:hypothetical protein